jgi:hypothetical protein
VLYSQRSKSRVERSLGGLNGNGREEDSFGTVAGVEAMKRHREGKSDVAELQSGSDTTPNEECPTLCKNQNRKGVGHPLSAEPSRSLAGIDLCASWVMVPREIRGFALSKISETCALILQKEAEPMKEANSGIANKAIEQILELSADAHIRRRGTVQDSPEFHALTGAIAAYGKALGVLTALQRREEFYAMIEQLDVPTSAQPVC